MVKQAACFFTGGYTESGALTGFLEKINQQVHFKQLCPNRPRGRKRPRAETDLKDEVSGLTGPALLDYVYHYLDKYPRDLADCDAVIIEDDLDGRFTELAVPGDEKTRVSRKTQAFRDHCQTVISEVQKRLGKDASFPVVLLFAAPEIEAWLLSDWEHTFGYVYGPKGTAVLTADENRFFSSRFRPYVRDIVLQDYANEVENYGYFSGEYKKLSDQLVSALQSFQIELGKTEATSSHAKAIAFKRELRYSKMLHGDAMLRQLSPDEVRKKCTVYFEEAFSQIKVL